MKNTHSTLCGSGTVLATALALAALTGSATLRADTSTDRADCACAETNRAAIAAAQYRECKEAATLAAPDAAPAADPAEVLLSVDGRQLTRGELDADVAALLAARGGQIPPAQVEQAKRYFGEQLAQQFIMKTLLLGEAAKKGLALTDEIRAKREAEFIKSVAGRPGAPKSFAEMAEKHPLGKERAIREINESLLIQQLLEQEVASKIKVDAKKVDDTLKDLTEKSAAAAKGAAGAEAKIKDFAKQLAGLKGDALAKKFAELAKANSDCPSKEKGGDLGEFTHGQMVKEFDEVAFKSEPFTVSAPVKTQFGWHLIMVTKKVPAVAAKDDRPASPEKVQASHILVRVQDPQKVPARAEVEKGLKRQQEQQAMRTYIETLRQAAKIEAPGFPNLAPQPKPTAK